MQRDFNADDRNAFSERIGAQGLLVAFIDGNMHHVNDYLMCALNEDDVMLMTLSEPLEDG